jgi:hypothetical protein
VLAALVVTMTALAAFARLAATSAVAAGIDERSEIADDLVLAAETAITDWLTSESGAVVLTPDALSPMVAVLDDEWTVGDDTVVRVRITAWDQEGMAPLSMLAGASPVRLGVPEEARSAADGVDMTGMPGLDAFEGAFPSTDDEQPALGALIATHNPLPDELASGRRTRRSTPARLNVSTAPVDLIAAAMRAEQRGGLEQVLQARARGEQPNMSDAPRAGGSEADLLLVNSSQTWSFRVDATVGNVERSWWTVWTRSGSEWKVVQRLVVDE